jgi:aerobic-type carbon monoxide dehydrogenase small subunit (CoxS/CutS family)
MTGFSSLGGQRSFQQNSVHDSGMKIFCGFCAKGQVLVRIRLDEKFPSVIETMKIRIHRLKKLSQDECKG